MNALTTLQSRIGVRADGDFGPNTLKAAASYFGLSRVRAAHFFGQTCHETGGYTIFEENLNYSAKRLHEVFPKRFPTLESATPYAGSSQKLANKIYGGRMGNEDVNDGWTYRGRGAIQLTGKSNYAKYGYLNNPDEVADKYAFDAALHYFEPLWSICDCGVNDATITRITKLINGGTVGLEERKTLTYKFAGIL